MLFLNISANCLKALLHIFTQKEPHCEYKSLAFDSVKACSYKQVAL